MHKFVLEWNQKDSNYKVCKKCWVEYNNLEINFHK
jgi:hypothetical protein